MNKKFVDYVKITVVSGSGGNGCVSFRREKYVPKGGPDGGNGGDGGSVYIIGDSKVNDLSEIWNHPYFKAKRGAHGQGANKTGRNGDDVYIHAPLGTVVSDAHGEIVDITEAEQTVLLAKGGKGGKGNTAFKTSTNRVPRIAEPGEDGEEKNYILELKVIADIGLIGLPNAGKSTLLAALTHAHPKIASYPFTTLHPNIGILQLPDTTTISLADIPGLIEGAHQGSGLGDRFLRHIERTKILFHLITDELGLFDFEDLEYKLNLINAELASYSKKLADKPQVIVISKIDLVQDEAEFKKTLAKFKEIGYQPECISAVEHKGLKHLVERMKQEIAELS